MAGGIVLLAWGMLVAPWPRRWRARCRPSGNLIGALREEDFSFRARTDGTQDPLNLAFVELNALAATLREERLGALEATALLRKVLAEIDVAVLAFDSERKLRLTNRAGERLLGHAVGAPGRPRRRRAGPVRRARPRARRGSWTSRCPRRRDASRSATGRCGREGDRWTCWCSRT